MTISVKSAPLTGVPASPVVCRTFALSVAGFLFVRPVIAIADTQRNGWNL